MSDVPVPCAACGRLPTDTLTRPCAECTGEVVTTFLRKAALVQRPRCELIERPAPAVKL